MSCSFYGEMTAVKYQVSNVPGTSPPLSSFVFLALPGQVDDCTASCLEQSPVVDPRASVQRLDATTAAVNRDVAMGCFAGSLLDVVLVESGSLVPEGGGGGCSSGGEDDDGFTTPRFACEMIHRGGWGS